MAYLIFKRIGNREEDVAWLREVTREKPMNWDFGNFNDPLGEPRGRTPQRNGFGKIETAEYTTDPEKAKRFRSEDAAEEYIRKNPLLRGCRIARAEE